MEHIVTISGKVDYTITLDPGVWIFDERKVDLTTYFDKPVEERGDQYTKEVSEHWDREITHGVSLSDKTNKISYNREKLLNGTFGIQLKPFLKNASPTKEATHLVIETIDAGQFKLSLSHAPTTILGFSQDGKPLKDGPVHVYYGDGSNKQNPIRNVTKLIVE